MSDAPSTPPENGNRSPRTRDKDKDRDRDREHRRDKDKDRHRDRDRDRDRDKDREREKRKKRSRSRSSRSRSRSGSNSRHKRRSSRSRSKSPQRPAPEEGAPETKDDRGERTVFVYQLHPKIVEKDLFKFFSVAGKVTDIRLIRDQRTKKSKGLAYIELQDIVAVQRALLFNGQPMGGYPINVTLSQSEKNRSAKAAPADSGVRLYIGSLHPSVQDKDLQPIFEAFGPVDFVDIHRDPATGVSRGYGFVQFKKAEHARAAMQQLNGLDVGGRPIKVSMPEVKSDPFGSSGGGGGGGGRPMSSADVFDEPLDDAETGGMNLTATSRAQLMQKLNSRAAIAPPSLPVMPGVGVSPAPTASGPPPLPPISSPPSTCMIVRNMFDPAQETEPDFDLDLKEDVESEVEKYGKLRHIRVDKHSKGGFVYLRFFEVSVAQNVARALHGRWFAKRQLSVDYMAEAEYSAMFADS